MKIGNKVYCKVDYYYNDIIRFKSGKYYNIDAVENTYCRVIGEDKWWSNFPYEDEYIQTRDDRYNNYYFSFYFFTEIEQRKIKLEKINELE